MSIYEGTTNPRSLAGEVGGVDELILEQLEVLPIVREAWDTTQTRGWAMIEDTIRARLEEVKNQAVLAPNMERLAECRGQIRSFNTFLAIRRSLFAQMSQLLEVATEYEDSVEESEEEE